MKKIVNNRLRVLIESQNLYNLTQFGFRTKLNTADPLICLHQQECDGFANNQFIMIISFDFQKVFDIPGKYKIMTTLKDNMAKFIFLFLTDCKFQIRIENICERANINRY